MLKYVFLILLPALAFADLETNLQNVLDLNKDGKISLAEADQYFLSYDDNKDGEVTLAEFKEHVDKVDTFFVGHETTLYTLLNRNGAGDVDKSDVDSAFTLADFNRNGYIDKSELHLIVSLAGSTVG